MKYRIKRIKDHISETVPGSIGKRTVSPRKEESKYFLIKVNGDIWEIEGTGIKGVGIPPVGRIYRIGCFDYILETF